MPAVAHRRFLARRPQIDECRHLVPIAAARQVVEELSVWLGVPLPARYAARLAFQSRRVYAHSGAYRRMVRRRGDAGRDALWMFLRHWLAARLHAERPDLFARLPRSYATGADLPEERPTQVTPASAGPLSPDARLLWLA